jgi:hypothetical protein
VTDTATESPERRRRRLAYAIAHPEVSDDEAAAIVDQEMAEEDEAEAERREHFDGIIASMNRLFTCSCSGVGASVGNRDGLCNSCRPVVARVRAERLEAEAVHGHTRRELAEAYVANRTGG